MSTFEGLIEEIEGISIDQFEGQNMGSRVYFLSHCHADHMVGINSDLFFNRLQINKFSIYTSELSAVILKNKYPRLSQHVIGLSIGETHTIHVPKSSRCEENFLSVALIPAGHCPGSVMFLFRTTDHKTILYTGDFRVNPEDLPKIKQLRNPTGGGLTIDKMYFDSTFWNGVFPEFPSRKDSCNIICDIIREWIGKGKEHVVNINLPAYYGSEYLYKDIADKLKMPIHVHENVSDSYRQVAEMDGVFTDDPEATQIHSCTPIKGCQMRKLTCRDCTHLIVRQIRPSAQKWSNMKENDEIFSQENQGFYVCYSSHCSQNELKQFLNYLKPRAIEPCVVPFKQRGAKNGEEILKMENFYESINTYCKDFLKVICKMNDAVKICNKKSAHKSDLPGCESNPSAVSKNKVIFMDREGEPPKKNSRLLKIKQNIIQL